MWFLFGEAGDFAKAVSNYLSVGEFSLKLGRCTVIRDSCHKQTGRVNHGVWPSGGKQISPWGDPTSLPLLSKAYQHVVSKPFCSVITWLLFRDCSMGFHLSYRAFHEHWLLVWFIRINSNKNILGLFHLREVPLSHFHAGHWLQED